MSERWPGGIVRSTPVTPSGPYQISTAPGIWTLAQASYWAKQGLWPTAGSFPPVELFFSTQVYTGTGSTQTITNGIDLSGQGGLVWAKRRDSSVSHILIDTTRGALNYLETNATSAQSVFANSLTGFTSSGYTMGGATNYNGSGAPFVSWTFRKATNFFDVVTYTGNGTNQTINHNLGSAPGMIIVKCTSAGSTNWFVYQRSLPVTAGRPGFVYLDSTSAVQTGDPTVWPSVPTATTFEVGSYSGLNANGATYVAYLFAHDAASTGLIQCGSYTGNGYAGAVPNTVTLGWEPQWVMIKKTSSGGATSDWFMFDNMRGMPVASAQTQFLSANTNGSEIADTTTIEPTSTGFQLVRNYSGTNANGENYIYVAIRRGPMRTPTVGTSVFSPVYQTFSGTTVTNTGFVTDLAITKIPATSAGNNFVLDRLRGSDNYTLQQTISTNSTSAEVASSGRVAFTSVSAAGYVSIQNGFLQQSTSANTVVWAFGRAPGFFDEVCYTGTGVNRTINHNLGVAPEVVLIKSRSGSRNWNYLTNFGASTYTAAVLNDTYAPGATPSAYDTVMQAQPTSTQFSVSTSFGVNNSGETYVAYLFASCPGVSKVGSYTGTGAAQTINCGFTTGARFILIKRTDSTGGWYTWDSARGISSGNDPYILLNSSSAQDSSTDYVGTDATGFTLTSSAPAALNANGGTYIFLAIS